MNYDTSIYNIKYVFENHPWTYKYSEQPFVRNFQETPSCIYQQVSHIEKKIFFNLDIELVKETYSWFVRKC